VDRKVPKLGLLLVGWGGNNGSTVTAGILANQRHRMTSWSTREAQRMPDYVGSVMMSSTIKLGTDAETLKDVNIPFHVLLPMVHPNDFVIGGWDISSMDLASAMDRAKVMEPSEFDVFNSCCRTRKIPRVVLVTDSFRVPRKARRSIHPNAR